MLYPAELRARLKAHGGMIPCGAPPAAAAVGVTWIDAGIDLEPPSAEKLIAEHLACMPIESLPVGHVPGAVLRENIYAERDHPPFDRVAMDGVALASSERGRRTPALQDPVDPGRGRPGEHPGIE